MNETPSPSPDEVLTRMLSTPPKPHESGKESKGGKKPQGR